jgi:hypothetical protein
VAVSGYRVDELAALAEQRLSTIAIGVFLCLAVCVLISPVWSGQELHRLTTRNMDKLADAVEACVEGYFSASASADTKVEGYKCVLNSKASEDAQANLAWWEPAHGRFRFRHPYAQYSKIGNAMRACAYCVEALSSCAGVEAQASEHAKLILRDACARVGARCARVLREASSSVAAFAAASRALDYAVADMNAALHELQGDLRSLPCMVVMLSETSLMNTMPLFTVASLLMEISARVEGVVDAVETLATLAKFKEAHQDDDDKKGESTTEMTTKVHPSDQSDAEDASPENQSATKA